MEQNKRELYQVFTRQYGDLQDIYEHHTKESLLNDLANIESLQTIEIIGIYKNGKPLSKTKIKVLLSWARG